MKPRFYDKYVQDIRPKLLEEGKFTNIHQVPIIQKIVINMGVSGMMEKGALDNAAADLATITGRKPVHCLARKSVSNFKLRAGQAIGCKVTLRRGTMWEFFDRLVTAALPRIRDFRGISKKAFDGRGNYSLGINDQSIFPEIELDKVKRQQGMDITIVTSAGNDKDAHELLTLMGMPFTK
ncbi:MAG: 50S ribosomal protein L5 [Verrucomicrobiota bacterium]|jgi:large subunit ribosomal protein L5|nr:50S ribosomal protein L5 [Verrucomicrobiota bacterium]